MFNDLNKIKSALTKLHQDMEATINRLAKTPSYLSMTEQLERTMEPIHRYQLKINRTFLDPVNSGALDKKILDANQHLQDVINRPPKITRRMWLTLTLSLPVMESEAKAGSPR